jgi:hypothetical protein
MRVKALPVDGSVLFWAHCLCVCVCVCACMCVCVCVCVCVCPYLPVAGSVLFWAHCTFFMPVLDTSIWMPWTHVIRCSRGTPPSVTDTGTENSAA